MMATYGHCMIPPVSFNYWWRCGGRLQENHASIEWFVKIDRRIWGKDESADPTELFSAQGGGQAEKRGRNSRQRDCTVKGLMVGGAPRGSLREQWEGMEGVWKCWSVCVLGSCPLHGPPSCLVHFSLSAFNYAGFCARNAFHLSGSLGCTTPGCTITSVLLCFLPATAQLLSLS